MIVGKRRYVEVSLDSAEVTHRPSNIDHGECYDQRTGAAIVALPATMRPCPGQPDDLGHHDPECMCFGTGSVAVQRPAFAPVDTVDDSLTALEDALAGHDDEGEGDLYLGASITELMRPSVDVSGGNGSGGRKGRQKPKPKRNGAFETSTTVEDGRVERFGRPPRFGERRDDRVRFTVAPETLALMEAGHDDIAQLANDLLAIPECVAILNAVRAERTR